MGWTRIDGVGRYQVVHNHLYVWCSGSNGVGDWLQNIDLRRVEIRKGERVNRRDLHEAFQIYFAVLNKVDVSEIGAVTICGFSRGGAIAQILAYVISTNDEVDVSLLLYASKRAGNGRFLQRLRSQVSRMVASYVRGDVVPFLPPWPLYRNVKHEALDKLHWPHKAHQYSARAAASMREMMTEGFEHVQSENH